jgi:AcrR family transcriptional regulator
MPRPYRLGQREAASEQTRARILAAARDLLIASDGFAGFSMDAVAKRADVARMTVYHQFGSKIGLLEGLCDLLAAGGGMEQMASAFQQPDPWAALERYVAQFGQLWAADRILTRRLRALAALDPDFAQVIRSRDEWRRQGLTVLLGRLPGWGNTPAEARAATVNALFTLLSFEFFDMLAGPERELDALAPEVYRLARAAVLAEWPDLSRGPFPPRGGE